jgi:hypothetical protein
MQIWRCRSGDLSSSRPNMTMPRDAGCRATGRAVAAPRLVLRRRRRVRHGEGRHGEDFQ